MNCSGLSAIIILAFFFCFPQKSVSQKNLDISIELQAYPTGLIPGISLNAQTGPKSLLYGRLAYNWIRHGDLGKHEDERGEGWGFSIAYKRAFKDITKGWRIGIKSDLWWNSIDWTEGSKSGSTEITVLQPTFEISYAFGHSKIIFTPTLAFGYEVNIRTVGEKTGEGAIILVGFQFGKRLK